jgi:hypothetical protein
MSVEQRAVIGNRAHLSNASGGTCDNGLDHFVGWLVVVVFGGVGWGGVARSCSFGCGVRGRGEQLKQRSWAGGVEEQERMKQREVSE